MDESRPRDLPDFENPPVAEVVLGLTFTTQNAMQVYHIGLYRSLIKDDLPKFREHPPLPPEGATGIQFQSGPPPFPRCWFLDAGENRLVQLQQDRFVHNWRKVKGDEKYPRYEGIRDEFIRRWKQFAEFAEREGIGRPRVSSCELTYVNNIPRGTCWSEPAEVPRLFRFLERSPVSTTLPPPEAIVCNIQYALPEDQGRLSVRLTPAVGEPENTEMLQFVLSVRSARVPDAEAGVVEWFGHAREWIVRGFADLTTKTAHDHWRRTR